MEIINITVWTVMQGDENSAQLRDLKISRDEAHTVFDTAAAEIDATGPHAMTRDGLRVSNGMDWVQLEPRTMTVPLSVLIKAIAEAPGAA